MTETNYVTQTKYFSPAFNAAIFDGPIRIYFAQYQEAQAMKIYFDLQARFQNLRRESRQFKDRNIFVMLYPDPETFGASFNDSRGAADGAVVCEPMGIDYVIGINGPFADAERSEHLYGQFHQILANC